MFAPRRQRVSVASGFLINGTAMGLFATQIPAVQQRLHLTSGALGAALFALAIGAVLAIPVSALLIARFGGRLVTVVALEALCGSLVLVAFSGSLSVLVLSCLVLGASNGTVDVAINALGVSVETLYGRPILSSFHGWYSIGGILGSAATVLAAAGGIDSRVRLLVGSAFLGFSALAIVHLLPATSRDVSLTWERPQRPTRTLMLLGTMAFCCLLGEGAAADWSGVLIRNVKLGSEAAAACGFLAFSIAMTVGRLWARPVIERWRPAGFVRIAGAVAATGTAIALFAPNPLWSVTGFAGLGLGLSCVFPLLLSRAAGEGSASTPQSLAMVTMAGYAGFVVGPAVIGVFAQVASLPAALSLVIVASIAVSVLAPALETSRDPVSEIPP